MRPSHLITRAEMNILDSYDTGNSTFAIAATLDVSVSTIHKWLVASGHKMRAGGGCPNKRKEKLIICQRCGILLDVAAEMDGAGSDTHCLDCLRAMNKVPRYQHVYVSGGNDPIWRVINTLGRAQAILGKHGEKIAEMAG